MTDTTSNRYSRSTAKKSVAKRSSREDISFIEDFDDFSDTESKSAAKIITTGSISSSIAQVPHSRSTRHLKQSTIDAPQQSPRYHKSEDDPERSGLIEIRHSFSKNRQKLLIQQGVDYNSFMRRNKKFDVSEALVKIQTEIPGVVSKTVSVKKQLKTLEGIIQRPLLSNPVIGISSYPSDLRAKNLALYLMNLAMDYYLASNSRRIRTKSYPLWHRVYGGFGDHLRDTSDRSDSYPCFLVITNCDVNSSNIKLEKIRDLLDRYSDIPRLVVCSDCDPLTYFSTKLHYFVTAGFYLGPDSYLREV